MENLAVNGAVTSKINCGLTTVGVHIIILISGLKRLLAEGASLPTSVTGCGYVIDVDTEKCKTYTIVPE